MFPRMAVSRGIAAHHISKNVTLYTNELVSSASRPQTPTFGDQKPLTLMLPWLGSRPKSFTKYCEIYFHTGFDVLVVESEVNQFLWPRWGLEHGKKLLELLESERFVSRPLLIHAFSIGGYTFAQLLMHVSQDTQKYQPLTGRIMGQVYDSLVVGSVENMAIGLSKTLFPRWETLVKQTSLLYFGLFKEQTVDYFNRAIQVFWDTPVTAPALFFYCANDALSDSQTLEELMDYWRKKGLNVTSKKWQISTHAGHLRKYPQEYLSTLERFLHTVHMTPLKAKI
ncbi:transmembrane protein 53 [Betta splendens]|uniref:Transmembrane protein 53 n=1 Tax=Betta splendens TaxID=158456 RepID=A0A6P7MTL4_BETSP|nr:transmembrane protein 53 [Betta splendens]